MEERMDIESIEDVLVFHPPFDMSFNRDEEG